MIAWAIPMDTVSHAAWGFVLLHRLPTRLVVAGAVAGAAPDLLFFVPSRIEQIVEHGWRGATLGRDPAIWRAGGPPLPPDLVEAYWRYYVWTHSLVLLGIAAGVGWLLLGRHRNWLWLCLPYALHILMDIPTHERYRTQPFYPFSDWQISGMSWADPRIFWPHLGVLAIGCVWAWRRRQTMLSKLAVVAAIVLCVTTSGVHAQKQLSVFASIVDAGGAPVLALQPADVRVLENGVEAKVISVEPIDWPTKLQLLVDNGVGLGAANINQLRNGILGLLDALPGMEVTIVSTAPQPRFLSRATTDRDVMMKGLALLTPDRGTGRFLEAMMEATQRIERDKDNHFPVIVLVGSTAGERLVLDSDVERLMKRLEQRPTTVHIVLLSGQSQSTIGGDNQVRIGLAVTKYTQGKYENINSATRLATLLPEIGALVAKSSETRSYQLRITVDRPAGASGELGTLSVGSRADLTVKSVSLDGRIP